MKSKNGLIALVMRALTLVLLFAICFNLAACAVRIKAESLSEGVAPRSVTPTAELSRGSVAAADLGLRLLREADEENPLFSPLSIMSALGMTANGAAGETLSQMEQTLGMSIEELNIFLYSYLTGLPQGEKYKLSSANSLWLNDNSRFTPNRDFLQTNADYYGAEIYSAPFDNSTLRDVNAWVKQKTDGMIPKVLNDIPESAVAYLINALAFEAEWLSIYEKHQVRDGTFTAASGEKREVELMYGSEGRYIEDEGAVGFMKSYYGGKYAFVALLPREGVGLSDYLSTLSGERLNALLTSPEYTEVKTAIPKFEAEYSTDLSEALVSLGMTDAFDLQRADFSRLGSSKAGNIFISRVIHKTFIEVGEKGTRAGAVTVVETNDGAACPPEDPKEVYLDRPFLYMLIDSEASLPFFIGTVTDIGK